VGTAEIAVVMPVVMLDCEAVVVEDVPGKSLTGIASSKTSRHPAGVSPWKATSRIEPKMQKIASPPKNARFLQTRILAEAASSRRARVSLLTRENTVEIDPTVGETSNVADVSLPSVELYPPAPISWPVGLIVKSTASAESFVSVPSAATY